MGLHASAGILFNHEGPRRGENFVTCGERLLKWIGDFIKWCATIDIRCKRPSLTYGNRRLMKYTCER